jgi:hypothetical protein
VPKLTKRFIGAYLTYELKFASGSSVEISRTFAGFNLFNLFTFGAQTTTVIKRENLRGSMTVRGMQIGGNIPAFLEAFTPLTCDFSDVQACLRRAEEWASYTATIPSQVSYGTSEQPTYVSASFFGAIDGLDSCRASTSDTAARKELSTMFDANEKYSVVAQLVSDKVLRHPFSSDLKRKAPALQGRWASNKALLTRAGQTCFADIDLCKVVLDELKTTYVPISAAESTLYDRSFQYEYRPVLNAGTLAPTGNGRWIIIPDGETPVRLDYTHATDETDCAPRDLYVPMTLTEMNIEYFNRTHLGATVAFDVAGIARSSPLMCTSRTGGEDYTCCHKLPVHHLHRPGPSYGGHCLYSSFFDKKLFRAPNALFFDFLSSGAVATDVPADDQQLRPAVADPPEECMPLVLFGEIPENHEKPEIIAIIVVFTVVVFPVLVGGLLYYYCCRQERRVSSYW